MNVVKGFSSRLRGLLTAALVLLLAVQLSLGPRPLQPGRLADGMLEIVLCSQGSMRTVLLNLETGEISDTEKPDANPAQSCPFCLTGIALLDDPPPLPVLAGRLVASLSQPMPAPRGVPQPLDLSRLIRGPPARIAA